LCLLLLQSAFQHHFECGFLLGVVGGGERAGDLLAFDGEELFFEHGEQSGCMACWARSHRARRARCISWCCCRGDGRLRSRSGGGRHRRARRPAQQKRGGCGEKERETAENPPLVLAQWVGRVDWFADAAARLRAGTGCAALAIVRLLAALCFARNLSLSRDGEGDGTAGKRVLQQERLNTWIFVDGLEINARAGREGHALR